VFAAEYMIIIFVVVAIWFFCEAEWLRLTFNFFENDENE
jgi:hypothetical protein